MYMRRVGDVMRLLKARKGLRSLEMVGILGIEGEVRVILLLR